MKRRLATWQWIVLMLPAVAFGQTSSRPERDALPEVREAIGGLRAATGDTARFSVSRATGTVRLVRFDTDRHALELALPKSANAEQVAQAALDQVGNAFGIDLPGAQLVHSSTETDGMGHTRVAFRQYHRGVPVFGALLHVHLDADRKVHAVNGLAVPRIDLNVTPRITAPQAEQIARSTVQQQLARRERLSAEAAELMVYRTNLARGIPGNQHLVYEVEVGGTPTVREFVYVDAHKGSVVDQITGIHDALDRRVYQGNFGDELLIWSEGELTPFGAPDVDNLIDYTEDTYNAFGSVSAGSYLSWDGSGGIMHAIRAAEFLPCPNASWNGRSINHCDNVTSDDVVAHEWAHAYTETTHGLIYAWQSGALNESYSDIWGELIDMLNNAGTDAPFDLRDDGACSGSGGSVRWLMGEDSTGFSSPIRDMWSPNCKGDPARVSDSLYWCTTGDSGGVHVNSGIPNHAFAMLVDGSTFNGQTIQSIGITKAAAIYWRAQSVYQTPSSTFADHADLLELSCSDLIGAELYQLSTQNPTGFAATEVLTQSDCDQVAAAMAAVEMRTEPVQCEFTPLLLPDPPALCDGAAPHVLLSTDWEQGAGDWAVGTRDVVDPATFDTPDWQVVTDLPDDRPGSAMFVPDLVIGDCEADLESGVLFLESPAVQIPAGLGDVRLSFDHWISTENRWDGGNLKISLNDGDWQLVPSAAFAFNPYPNTLNDQGDNPLMGEPAFTGSDGGSLFGSWGQSQVSLDALAAPGDSVRLRFEMGLDGCNGRFGWYVDELSLFGCSCLDGGDPGAGFRYFADGDGDGYGNPASEQLICSAVEGYVQNGDDCNDSDPLVNPGMPEVCADGLDNDCSAVTADLFDADFDQIDCTLDCNDADGTAWETPGEVQSLLLWPGGQLSWSAPEQFGGTTLDYELLRATGPTAFVTPAACIPPVGRAAIDEELPAAGVAWYYLVRGINGCSDPGPVGFEGLGQPRSAGSCPGS